MINKEIIRYIEQFDESEQPAILTYLINIREQTDLHCLISDETHFKLIKDKIISRNYLSGEHNLLICFYDDDDVPVVEVPKTIRQIVQDRLFEYRSMFKGVRVGAMGDRNETAMKMERFLINNNVSFDAVLEATAYYISNSGDFVMNADNFIYTLNREGREYSKLQMILEEYDGSVSKNLLN